MNVVQLGDKTIAENCFKVRSMMNSFAPVWWTWSVYKNNSRKEPTDLSAAMLLNDFLPLNKLMSEQIDALRKWAKGRARRATVIASGSEIRKIFTPSVDIN